MEGDVEGSGEFRQTLAGGVKQLRRGPQPGDSEGLDLPRFGGEDVEQSGPLEALHNVEIDDVDVIGAVEGLLDGLIGREVGEFD